MRQIVLQFAKRIGRCVALPIEYGLHIAFAIVEIRVMHAALLHVEQAADAAAQVQAPGVFTSDDILPISILQGQEPVA